MITGQTELLKGYRVLDLTEGNGWLCGKILGDLGADVIKIERPGGDPGRNIGPFYKDIVDPEKSLYWFAFNMHKRGITLNIETEDGREIFKRLVEGADFVIESYPPGYMDRLGLGYPVLSKINPRIIMTSITAFGQTGPYAHYKAPDIVGMAMGGMVYLCGDEDRPPVRISYPQAWNHASLQGCVGTMFAHYYREMTGEGQHVDVSMQTCVIWTLMNATVTWDLNRINIKRGGAIRTREVQRGDKIVPYRQQEILPCKDGYVYLRVMGGAVGGEQCQILVQWMDEEGMASESMKQRDWMALDFFTITQEDVDSWEGPIKDFLMTHTREEIYQEALKRRLSIAPVGTPKMLLEDKQLAFRNFWVDVEHPELGTAITYPGWPVHQSETPWRLQRRAPLIGEHNDEIYEKELGFSKEQLSVLKACGVI